MHENKIQKVWVQTQADPFLDTWPSATAFHFPHRKHTALTGVWRAPQNAGDIAPQSDNHKFTNSMLYTWVQIIKVSQALFS